MTINNQLPTPYLQADMSVAIHPIDYDEFRNIQKSYPRTLSNDYLMPEELKKLIEFKKLSYISDEKALYTLIKREGLTKLVYRLKDSMAELPQIDEPIAAYLIYKEDKPTPDDVKWLTSRGFTHAVKLIRYTAREIANAVTDENVEAATADETYAMLNEIFKSDETDLPCKDMWSGGAICIKAGDGSLLGLVYDMGHTRIVAVSPKARGQGIGGKLYRTYAAKAMEKTKNPIFHEWIRPDNTSSIAMFKKLGFIRDTLTTDCYIKWGNNT